MNESQTQFTPVSGSPWLKIYHQINADNKTLEILAVGEHKGETMRVVKAIPLSELT